MRPSETICFFMSVKLVDGIRSSWIRQLIKNSWLVMLWTTVVFTKSKKVFYFEN